MSKEITNELLFFYGWFLFDGNNEKDCVREKDILQIPGWTSTFVLIKSNLIKKQ